MNLQDTQISWTWFLLLHLTSSTTYLLESFSKIIILLVSHYRVLLTSSANHKRCFTSMARLTGFTSGHCYPTLLGTLHSLMMTSIKTWLFWKPCFSLHLIGTFSKKKAKRDPMPPWITEEPIALCKKKKSLYKRVHRSNKTTIWGKYQQLNDLV